MYADEPMTKPVIRNLIDKAAKITTATSIAITAAYSPDKQSCKISIADDGKGMSEEQLAEINQYFQTVQLTLPTVTSGFGHKLIKDFLVKMGGTIQYRHNLSSGIVVTVNLPTLNEKQLFAE